MFINVIGARKDGYHELQMIMVPIDLFDTLEFELADKITLESDISIENNAVIKAAKLMQTRFNINKGVKIKLSKKIPIGAGLGGASADIAATLRGLNQLWELNLELEDHVFDVYPNPSSETSTLTISLAKASKVSVLLFNALGENVKTIANANLDKGLTSLSFDVSELASGMYFVKLTSANYAEVKKFQVR